MMQTPIEGSERDSSPMILVVDDDDLTRHTLALVLSKAGYRVIEAASGKEAIRLYQQQGADLVLLDVIMPELDGFEVCRQLRQQTDYQLLPIVMLTGLDDPAAVDDAFHSGATDFITKPLNWTLLTQRVRYGLRGRAMSLELSNNRAHLAYAQRIAKLGYWEYAPDDDVFVCSDEVLWILGSAAGAIPKTLMDFLNCVSEADRRITEERIRKAITSREGYTIDHSMIRCDGQEIAVHQQGKMEQGDSHMGWRLKGTIQDITERKRAEALIEYQAYYDDLTGLPNRRLFIDRLIHALDLADKTNRFVTVMLIGVDHLVVINESLGHIVGDQLLKSVASRLGRLSGMGYTVSRVEGDIFGVLIEGITNVEVIEDVAKNILLSMADAHHCGEHELYANASVGIALQMSDAQNADVLMREASIAMHRAKEVGGNQYRYFEVDMNTRAQARLTLANALRKAQERGELSVYYQPQVSTRTGAVVGAEALLRWQHPEHGFIPPDKFISVAEETGLIIEIGAFVLDTACKNAREIIGSGFPSFRIGVNFSAKQFMQPDLLAQISDTLTRNAVPPANLDVEITESIALHDFDATVATLQRMREMGMSASIDDFGTGFCSLSYLHKLPVTTLKIDRAFVKDINERGERGEIAKAITAMAHSLGLSVIAEGVETPAQYTFMKALGCNEIQGYLIAKPMPYENFLEFLSSSIVLHKGL